MDQWKRHGSCQPANCWTHIKIGIRQAWKNNGGRKKRKGGRETTVRKWEEELRRRRRRVERTCLWPCGPVHATMEDMPEEEEKHATSMPACLPFCNMTTLCSNPTVFALPSLPGHDPYPMWQPRHTERKRRGDGTMMCGRRRTACACMPYHHLHALNLPTNSTPFPPHAPYHAYTQTPDESVGRRWEGCGGRLCVEECERLLEGDRRREEQARQVGSGVEEGWRRRRWWWWRVGEWGERACAFALPCPWKGRKGRKEGEKRAGLGEEEEEESPSSLLPLLSTLFALYPSFLPATIMPKRHGSMRKALFNAQCLYSPRKWKGKPPTLFKNIEHTTWYIYLSISLQWLVVGDGWVSGWW